MDKMRKALVAFVKLSRKQGLRPPEIRNLLLGIGLSHGLIDQVFEQINIDTKPIALSKSTNVALIQKAIGELRRAISKDFGNPLTPPPLPTGFKPKRPKVIRASRRSLFEFRKAFDRAVSLVLVVLIGVAVFESMREGKVGDKKPTLGAQTSALPKAKAR
jgi:hypothetical protein